MPLANKLIVCVDCGKTLESREDACLTENHKYRCSSCNVDKILDWYYKNTGEDQTSQENQ